MAQVVSVFGVTDFVGSSIARTLSGSGWEVHGLVSISNSSNVTALEQEGIKVQRLDLSDKQSVTDALNGSTACFVQTDTEFTNPQCQRAEVVQGKLIGDACKAANVRHVIYSTQLSVVKTIGMTSRHMDAKAEIELYMRDLRLPMTSLIIPFHYEQLLMPPYRPSAAKDGCYHIGVPMGYHALHMMSTEDVGPIVKHILSNPGPHMNKTISICGDKLTIKEVAGIFTKVFRPQLFRDKQVTVEEFGSQGEPSSHDMAMMFDFYCRVDQRASVDLTRKMHPATQTLEDWLFANIDVVMAAIIQCSSSMEDRYYSL